MPRIYKISARLECPGSWDVSKVESFLCRQLLTTSSELASLRVHEIPPAPAIEPGIYWVWYDNRWTMGIYDGFEWDVEGASFGHPIPIGPRWTVPDRPEDLPILSGPMIAPGMAAPTLTEKR